MAIEKKSRKIALLGSAPCTLRYAPWADESWEIWGCSPGAAFHTKRANAWFEIHRWEPPEGYTGPKIWFTPDYISFMARMKGPVFMIEPVPQIPTSVAYPLEDILRRYGRMALPFWTSSLAWMLALAIAEGATEIGLYGVDMNAHEEYGNQRLSCQYFCALAMELGIKIHVDPESDLLMPAPLYGFCEVDPMHIKLLTRKDELSVRKHDAEVRMAAARDELVGLSGALDDNGYMMKTWVHHPVQREIMGEWNVPLRPSPVEAPSAPVAEVPIEGSEWKPIAEADSTRKGRKGKLAVA